MTEKCLSSSSSTANVSTHNRKTIAMLAKGIQSSKAWTRIAPPVSSQVSAAVSCPVAVPLQSKLWLGELLFIMFIIILTNSSLWNSVTAESRSPPCFPLSGGEMEGRVFRGGGLVWGVIKVPPPLLHHHPAGLPKRSVALWAASRHRAWRSEWGGFYGFVIIPFCLPRMCVLWCKKG